MGPLNNWPFILQGRVLSRIFLWGEALNMYGRGHSEREDLQRVHGEM